MNKRVIHLISLLLCAVLIGLAVWWPRNRDPDAPTWTPEQIQQAARDAKSTDAVLRPSVARLLGEVRQVRRAPMLGSQPYTLQAFDSGALSFIGMEPGWSVGRLHPGGAVPDAARDFILARREAFGLENTRADFTRLKHRALDRREIVKLQQTYAGLPVFSAQAILHCDASREVTCVLLDAGSSFDSLDQMPLPLQPAISSADAVSKAMQLAQARAPMSEFDLRSPPEARLVVYSPEVLGFIGDSELAWEIITESSPAARFPASELMLISARDGAVLNRIERIHSALSRRVFDAALTLTAPATPTRDNGGAETNIAEVDNTYSFLTQAWAFYSVHHGRDSFDGNGATIDAEVRLRVAGTPSPAVPNPPPIPWRNATSQSGLPLRFGEGFTADDVVMHELTHSVTRYESGLIYQNASGAMDESFSDIWGEAFDQTNIGSVDPVADRWLLGEDVPLAAGDTRDNTAANRALRNMANPPDKGHPDRVRSPNFRPAASYPRSNPPLDNNDNGGVHSNSGVGNKLFFLLVDGGTFNFRTITSIGSIELTPLDLFYEVQTNLLTPASDWRNLNLALRYAAITLGFSNALRTEVAEACEAVEIDLPPARTVFMDSATNAPNKVGIPEVNGSYGPYTTLATSLNAAAGDAAHPEKGGGIIKINGASGQVTVPAGYVLDRPVTIGTYDTFIQIVPPPVGSPAGTQPTANPIPPTPVVIRTAP